VDDRDDADRNPPPERAGAWSALRSRNFAMFWSAALVSNTGTWMQGVTVPFVIDQMTHSTVWVGVSAFCTYFPATVVSPFAGPLADRHSRKAVLIVAQTVMMLVATALWLTYAAGVATPGIILVLVTISGCAAGVNISTWQAFVTQLVPNESLLSAIRINSMQFTASRAIGPALAGLVLATLGASVTFFANAVTFLGIIAVLLVLRPREVAPAVTGHSLLADFRDGWRYTRARRVLLLSVLAPLVIAFFGVSMSQMIEPYVRHVLHKGAGEFGLLVGSFGFGAIVAALLMVALGDRLRRSTFTMLGFACFVAGELLVGIVPQFGIAMLGLSIAGIAQVLVIVSNQTATQVNVDEEYRGRVLAIFTMCFFTGAPIGALIAGIVAQFVGIRATYVIAAVLLTAAGAVLVARFERFRPLDESRAGFDVTVETTGAPGAAEPA
jgi:MFS family permease